jgi:hypothetical protein
MNKNLVICPTYQRPAQFSLMVESFYKNSVCSDLIVLTEQGSITALINSVNYTGYEYVGVTNDDFVYHTKGWDKTLIETLERKGYGIAFGNDGTNNSHLPSTCLMSTAIPKALGYIQLPTLTHLCGDMVWQYIGKKMNCLYYHPHVKIEHMHFLFGKAEKHEYERTNSREMYINDNVIFKEWVTHESEKDINKIKVELGL